MDIVYRKGNNIKTNKWEDNIGVEIIIELKNCRELALENTNSLSFKVL